MLLSLSFVFVEWLIMQAVCTTLCRVSAQCYAGHLHRLMQDACTGIYHLSSSSLFTCMLRILR